MATKVSWIQSLLSGTSLTFWRPKANSKVGAPKRTFTSKNPNEKSI